MMVGEWRKIIDAAAAATSAEVECIPGGQLLVFHHIQGSTGGYASVFHRPMSAKIAAQQTSVAIATAARATNVVTLTFTPVHNVKVGDYITIQGITGTAASMNGTFIVATTADTKTLTYAQTAGNETATAATGHIHCIPEIPAATADGALTYNVKTSDQTASYLASYGPVGQWARVGITVGGGTHSVWVLATSR